MQHVFHIYKTNCYGSSRLELETSWDEKFSLLHLPALPTSDHIRSPGNHNARLSYANLMRVVFSCARHRECISMVFHAQSSLPYLFFALILLRLFDCTTHVAIAYDIHDFHEKPTGNISRIAFFVSLARYCFLFVLEKAALRLNCVRSFTVSAGLATLIARRYDCSPPAVVHSVHRVIPALVPLSLRARSARKNIVFFGTRFRIPYALFDQFVDSDLFLDIYSTDATTQLMAECYGGALPTKIRYKGGYSPSNLNFLRAYSHLVLYCPTDKAVNLKIALPNKFFQAIAYGLRVIVSDNFHEVIEFSRSVPGLVQVLRKPMDLHKYIADSVHNDPELRLDQIHELVQKTYLSSMNQYHDLVLP